MTSRKEERKQLRQAREEKEAAAKARQRKTLVKVYAAAGFVAIIVVAGVIVGLSLESDSSSGDAHVSLSSGQTNGVALDERAGTELPEAEPIDLKTAAREASCELRAKLPNEGSAHLSPEATPPKYGTNPPTSGNHVAPPYQQADGAYSDTPEAMDVVHSLEHGRLAIQYSGELPRVDQLELRGLYDSAYSAALLFPNDQMPYEVAATSWGEMLGCKSYQGAATLAAIRAFGAKYHGTAPEPVEAFGPLTGPTFAGETS